MEKRNLLIDRDWELRLVDKVCDDIRSAFSTERCAILQLSYEYSGLLAQLMAHKLSQVNGPLRYRTSKYPIRWRVSCTHSS